MNEKKSPKSILFAKKLLTYPFSCVIIDTYRFSARFGSFFAPLAVSLFDICLSPKSIDFGKNEEKEKGKMM